MGLVLLNIVLILLLKSLIFEMKAFSIITVSFKKKKRLKVVSHLQVFYIIIYCKKTDVSQYLCSVRFEILPCCLVGYMEIAACCDPIPVLFCKYNLRHFYER